MDDLVAKHLKTSMRVLHKVSCHNWMPTMNKTTPKHDSFHMLHMVLKPFNFGQLMIDKISHMANAFEKTPFQLSFLNFIYQVLCF